MFTNPVAEDIAVRIDQRVIWHDLDWPNDEALLAMRESRATLRRAEQDA